MFQPFYFCSNDSWLLAPSCPDSIVFEACLPSSSLPYAILQCLKSILVGQSGQKWLSNLFNGYKIAEQSFSLLSFFFFFSIWKCPTETEYKLSECDTWYWFAPLQYSATLNIRRCFIHILSILEVTHHVALCTLCHHITQLDDCGELAI